MVLGLVFGNAKLVERYAETSIMGEAGRIGLHKFGLTQFKEFWLFGYGAGAFELIFKLFYSIPPNGKLAIHAHNDGSRTNWRSWNDRYLDFTFFIFNLF